MDLSSYLLGKKSGGGGGEGTSDYSSLTNKPSINGVTLDGNKTGNDLNLGDSIKYYYIRYTDSQEQYQSYFEQWLEDYKNNIKDIVILYYEYTYAICYLTFTYNEANGNGNIKISSTPIYNTETNQPYGITTQRFQYAERKATITNNIISLGGWYINNQIISISRNSDKLVAYNNTTAFTPTGDYNLAHKKYVDDSIASAITTTLGGSY